jgi:hypothetical protein
MVLINEFSLHFKYGMYIYIIIKVHIICKNVLLSLCVKINRKRREFFYIIYGMCSIYDAPYLAYSVCYSVCIDSF